MQPLHRSPHVLGERQVPHRTVEVVAALGGLAGVALLALATGHVGPQDIDGTAVGLRQQVTAQGAPFGVEALGMVPEPEEDLLHHLFGLGLIRQDPLRQAEHGAGVSPVDLAERLLLEARQREHEARVGGCGEVVSHDVCTAPSGIWITNHFSPIPSSCAQVDS